jgi:hypothetical protein
MQNRGFVDTGEENKFNTLNRLDLLQLLSSKISVERTSAARLIKKYKEADTVKALCSALEKEKKLYTKLEICNSLTQMGTISLPQLIGLLGKIGNNQHKEVDKKEFKKSSYPLPRDIVARTIVRFKTDALPFVDRYITTYNKIATPEAIDVVGHICFYNNNNYNHLKLINIIETNPDNDLLRWKVIRALSAFCSSTNFLENQLSYTNNKYIIREIKRSIDLIKKQELY